MLALSKVECYYAHTPKVDAINAAGAGDVVSAALVWRLSLGDAWQNAIRWAAAAGAAGVLAEKTGECRVDDIQRILNETIVEPIRK